MKNPIRQKMISALMICLTLMQGCSKNDLEEKLDNDNSDQLVFDYNFQVFEEDKTSLLVKNVPKLYEIYLKGSFERNTLKKDIKFNVTIDNQNIKGYYILIRYDPDIKTSDKEIQGLTKEALRFGDICTIKSDQLVDGKAYLMIIGEGIDTGDTNLNFNLTWNNVIKNVVKKVTIL